MRRRDAARRAAATPRRSRPRSGRRSTTDWRASSAPPRNVEANFTWEQCGQRDASPPTRTRCDDKPVLFVTNHAPPFRVGAFAGAARARGRRLRADRRRRPPRRRRHRRRRSDAVPRRAPAPARRRAARRLRPLPRRDRRAVRPGRAARGLRGRPRRAGPVRAVGDDLAPPAHARAARSPIRRCATSTGTRTRSPPTARTSAPTCAPSTRAGRCSRRRRRRRGVLVGAARRPSATATSRSCSPAGPCPRRASTCFERAADVGTLVVAADRTRERSAQPLRGQRRCGRTVGSHARLPRAVGARRQRSLPPGSSRDRHRCRRSRRGRTRAARAHRARRARRRRGGAAAPRCTACTTTPRCAARSARTPGARSPPTRHEAWAEGMSRALSAAQRAASVNSPMRRTIFLALLAALLLAPAAHARRTRSRSSGTARTTACSRATTRPRSCARREGAADRHRRVLRLPRRPVARDQRRRFQRRRLDHRRRRQRRRGRHAAAAARRDATPAPAADRTPRRPVGRAPRRTSRAPRTRRPSTRPAKTATARCRRRDPAVAGRLAARRRRRPQRPPGHHDRRARAARGGRAVLAWLPFVRRRVSLAGSRRTLRPGAGRRCGAACRPSTAGCRRPGRGSSAGSRSRSSSSRSWPTAARSSSARPGPRSR